MASYKEELDAFLEKKPAAYSSAWQSQITGLLDELLKRQAFTYDPQSDALYRGYRDQHLQLGKQAMQDAMGEAAALTGGYSNSYAQSVGQQAYQAQAQQLQEKIPELYALAQSRYQQQGEAMENKLSLLQEQENQAYGQYLDKVSSWQKEADRLQSLYESQREYDYRLSRDQVSDEQWKKEFNEAVRRFNQTAKG